MQGAAKSSGVRLCVEWLEDAGIPEIQAAMAAGEVTARDLTLFYLKRIADYNLRGVAVNAVLEVNPDAVHIAQALDVERRLTGSRGPLHGIPILLKDNIDTGDKMHTSAGSVSLASSFAAKDSFVAKQLRDAGAVILGKTNLTEFANFMTENMPNGYSSRGGQVLNPYGPGKFDVGGSSSGSGAGAAVNFAVATIGTETSGSILSPASENSVVGIKPTVGLISRSGIIPIAHSQDTAGPMARNVTNAAIMLGALSGVDERDAATWSNRGFGKLDYASSLNKDGLRGARIGVPRKFYYEKLSEDKLSIMNRVLEELAAAGATIVDPVEIPTAKQLNGHAVLVYEFKAALNFYLSALSPSVPVHSLQEVIAFNEAHRDVALKYGQTILIESEATTGTLTEAEYLEARIGDLRMSTIEGLDEVMQRHQLDAILFPANYGAAIAAKAGYPSVCVPAGYTTQGTPLGATFTGLAYSESTLIRLAYAYEQATQHRIPPVL